MVSYHMSNNIDQAVTELTAPAPERVKVDDIFRYSWGYDQTNVDYYQAIRVTAQSVVLRPIGQEQVPGTDKGGMSCKVRPRPNYFGSTKTLTKRIKFYRGEAYVSMNHGIATRVKPTEEAFCSWYA